MTRQLIQKINQFSMLFIDNGNTGLKIIVPGKNVGRGNLDIHLHNSCCGQYNQ
jgi:hypothetical protein